MKILDYSARYWAVIDPRRVNEGSPTALRGILTVPKFWDVHGWEFDGNVECPTITPSINESWGPMPLEFCSPAELAAGRMGRNHYIITGGAIQFCGDCTHSFAGQTLALPDFTEAERAFYEGAGDR